MPFFIHSIHNILLFSKLNKILRRARFKLLKTNLVGISISYKIQIIYCYLLKLLSLLFSRLPYFLVYCISRRTGDFLSRPLKNISSFIKFLFNKIFNEILIFINLLIEIIISSGSFFDPYAKKFVSVSINKDIYLKRLIPYILALLWIFVLYNFFYEIHSSWILLTETEDDENFFFKFKLFCYEIWKKQVQILKQKKYE